MNVMKRALISLGLLAALILPASAAVTGTSGPLDDVLLMNKRKARRHGKFKRPKQKKAKWGVHR